MAGPAVMVGVAGGSSNERVHRCCRLPRGSRIMYIRLALYGSSSLDAAPVTGSLLFYVPVCCLAVCCAAEFSSWVLFGGADCIWLAGRGMFFWQVGVTSVMATDSAAAGGRAGITFGVELVVPWDAPEAVVDLHSDGVVDLETAPDVIGLTGSRSVSDSAGKRCAKCVCFSSGFTGAEFS